MDEKTIRQKFIKEIESRCEKMLYAGEKESETYNYYSASAILMFADIQLELFDRDTYNRLDKQIEESHRKYFEKVINDLESVHKRIF